MPDSPIRVLLVDDSQLVITLLRRLLARSAEIRVVGTAADGQQAWDMLSKVRPDVVCTDLYMPRIDGLELTRRIMAEHPLPILVLSTAVGDQDAENVFQLLAAGALDVLPKPRADNEAAYAELAAELVSKIRVLAGVRVFPKRTRRVPPAAAPVAAMSPVSSAPAATRVVALGASTGGPQAYEAVLSKLPADFPAPLVCVQHIGKGFLSGMVQWLNSRCRMQVAVAASGQSPRPGTVYFAPDEYHLEMDSQRRLLLTKSPPRGGHRPSVTVLFQSVAARIGEQAVGVLLTGMGRDGAEGLQSIAAAGGVTIVQDEETSVVFGMPKSAIELGASQIVLPVDRIPSRLIQLLKSTRGTN